VSSALTGDIRTGGDSGLFEYAAASINVNEARGALRRAWSFRGGRSFSLIKNPVRCKRVRCRKIGGLALLIRSS
jgi:hypothetical protein